MFIEKKLRSIAPRLFAANGSLHGLITLADIRGFSVGQEIILASSSQPELQVKIKRFVSLNSFYVGGLDTKIGDRTDVSAYLVADTAYAYAKEQHRPGITQGEHERAVYMEEPIVAKRVIGVDEYGNFYNTDNPVPVTIDGDINVGTVDVKLTHKENFPNPGDVADSVQIGDGVEVIQVNPDGSINVVASTETVHPETMNLPLVLANTSYVLALPAGIRRFSMKIRDGMGPLKIYDGVNYFTVSRGGSYDSMFIKNTALSLTVQSGQAAAVLEVQCWVLGP
jgi:hypothetical protein